MNITKFYQYNVWIEDDAGHRLAPLDSLEDDVFSEQLEELPDTGEKSYALRFRQVETNQYHGIVVRSEDEGNFSRVTDGSLESLKDLIGGEGRITNTETDCVDFGLRVGDSGISLLVEVGYQTPGIGVIKRYLNEHIGGLSEYSLEHKTELDHNEGELGDLLDRDLKKAVISFKKNPMSYDDLDLTDDLRNVTPDDYRLKFEVSLERGGDQERWKVREYVSHVMNMVGLGEGPVEDTIAKIDFPKFMHMFKIEPVEIEGEEESVEDIADMIRKRRIDTSQYGIFDKNLGERLCREVVQR